MCVSVGCVFVCVDVFTEGQKAALYNLFAYCLLTYLSAGAFTLQRTKAMFTVIVDFIWLMHCHGCRLGQVLFVIKWMCWPPRLFQVGHGSWGGGRGGCRDLLRVLLA